MNLVLKMWNGTLMGEDCFPKQWYPNVFLMSILLSVFTYSVCVTLKGMKHTLYFPYKVHQHVLNSTFFPILLKKNIFPLRKKKGPLYD